MEEFLKSKIGEDEVNNLGNCCYATNNRFAYKYDLNGKIPYDEMKIYNFVPTYDKWCLYCNNKENVTYRCSQCKFVFFCNKECQKNAWTIHKNHCKRNLFELCIMCGNKDTHIKCNNKCGVGYCSTKCKEQIESEHDDFDCDYFKSVNK